MHPDMYQIRCTVMRGGTSKGIFIHKNALPAEIGLRSRVIQAIFGSPDLRQIDGLGGADTLTSKLAIIAPSTHPDADVEYTFAQVGIAENIVDYGGNCGNISSGVGPFAIDEGMVEATEPITSVRIWQTNTQKLLVAQVPVRDGYALSAGEFHIDGVPGTGAKITMDFSDTVGSVTGALLPTGYAADPLDTEAGRFRISVVDAGIPVVFIAAESLGLSGTESAAEIDSNAALLRTVEAVRGAAAVAVGLAESPAAALADSPYSPFFAIVSPPADYRASDGTSVSASETDILSRLLFMQKMHKTYPGTGSVATAAAVRIQGSVAHEALRPEARERTVIRIGHPAGVMPAESETESGGDPPKFRKLAFYRTARRIMDGMVYVPKSVFE
jgi:2-methylaconitate cis-trans-isomerase PrpF